jgi:Uma2 family endonuclease
MALQLLRGPFTVDAYQRLAELGVLRENDRVELIAGQVVELSPIGDHHASCVRRLNRLFSRHLLEVAIVDVQNPVVLGEHDAPQPDLVLLKPRADGYPQHPRATDILLVIEVADTSIAYDRDIKIPLYARAGIREAWLVDLAADRIDVYQDPIAGQYAAVRTVCRGDVLTPLQLPHVTLAVDEILG